MELYVLAIISAITSFELIMMFVSCECIHDWVSVVSGVQQGDKYRQRTTLTHVTVTENGNLVIKHGKLDVTVPLLVNGIQRPNLVLAGVPVDFEVLLLILLAKDLVECLDNLFVGTTLEGDRFSLIIESCVDGCSVKRRYSENVIN
jgi:hypothetical protein